VVIHQTRKQQRENVFYAVLGEMLLGFEYILRVERGVKMVAGVYNCTALFLRDINTGTWNFTLADSGTGNNTILSKVPPD
jgi:hypothetical protein